MKAHIFIFSLFLSLSIDGYAQVEQAEDKKFYVEFNYTGISIPNPYQPSGYALSINPNYKVRKRIVLSSANVEMGFNNQTLKLGTGLIIGDDNYGLKSMAAYNFLKHTKNWFLGPKLEAGILVDRLVRPDHETPFIGFGIESYFRGIHFSLTAREHFGDLPHYSTTIKNNHAICFTGGFRFMENSKISLKDVGIGFYHGYYRPSDSNFGLIPTKTDVTTKSFTFLLDFNPGGGKWHLKTKIEHIEEDDQRNSHCIASPYRFCSEWAVYKSNRKRTYLRPQLSYDWLNTKVKIKTGLSLRLFLFGHETRDGTRYKDYSFIGGPSFPPEPYYYDGGTNGGRSLLTSNIGISYAPVNFLSFEVEYQRSLNISDTYEDGERQMILNAGLIFYPFKIKQQP